MSLPQKSKGHVIKKTVAQLEKEIEEIKELQKYKEGLPFLFGQKFYPWAKRIWDSNNREIFLTSANQVGKALRCVTEVLTPDGFRIMGALRVGDIVYGQDGKPTTVVAIPYEGRRICYRISFTDGTSIDACGEHLWFTKSNCERFRKTYTNGSRKRTWDNPDYDKWVVRSTEQIINVAGYGRKKISPAMGVIIPVAKPVEYSSKPLFDPYYFGLWLGNGSKNSVVFHELDIDLVKYAEKYGNKRKTSGRAQRVGTPKSLFTEQFYSQGMSDEKYIPEKYFYGSIEQRKELLAGLLDTDGGQGFSTDYYSTSLALAEGVNRLVCSLGGLAQVSKRKGYYKKTDGAIQPCKDLYTVRIYTEFNPFRSLRKSAKWRAARRGHFRLIESIEAIGEYDVRCITVDNADGSFLATRNLIVTHNSSIAIRKNIRLATDPTLWPKFWPNLAKGQAPNLFWYLYPTMPVAQTEWETKWLPVHMPKGEFKTHPIYGWKEEYEKGLISKIRFNSGVQIQFKAYSMKVKDLQTASVYHVTSDEELPIEFLPEIAARTNSTDGYFLHVFTATLGQRHWQQTMEPITKSEEKHKDALKIQVSLFDSQFFDDGTPSHWTNEKIKRAIANCPTDAEIQRRVYGRFVKASGLLYEGFSVGKNMVDPHPIPKSWSYWSGTDIGSGGQSGHPASDVFIAVSDDFTSGVVFRAWRGDGIPTTATDILEQHARLRANLVMTNQAYDFAAADFYTVACRRGEAFSPANKRREAGIGLLNTLFKTGMLKLFRDDPEIEKLAQELGSIGVDANKRQTLDDLSDALRYCCMAVPWNFAAVDVSLSVDEALREEAIPVKQKSESDLRREFALNQEVEGESDDLQSEFDFWNDLSGA